MLVSIRTVIIVTQMQRLQDHGRETVSHSDAETNSVRLLV